MVEFEEIQGQQQQQVEVPPSQERLLDAEEIEKAAATMSRPTAKMHLEALAKKLRKESEALKRVEASRASAATADDSNTQKETKTAEAATTAPIQAATKENTPLPPKTAAAEEESPVVGSSMQYVRIDKFAFDAGGYNSAFVTLYVDLPNVGSISKDNITCEFKDNSFDLIVKDLNGKSYRLFKDNLENDIDVEKSKKVVKADKILVKLAKKKSEYGTYDHWSSLTAKKKKKPNTKENPATGIMDLMKQMYEEGDDNMRKVIGETMMKQRTGELDKGLGGTGNFGEDDF